MHVRDIGLSRSHDEQVLAAADTDGRVSLSSDTDFGELLSRSQAGAPSVLLLRRQANRRADEVAGLILANLDAIADDLQTGSIVVLDDTRDGRHFSGTTPGTDRTGTGENPLVQEVPGETTPRPDQVTKPQVKTTKPPA